MKTSLLLSASVVILFAASCSKPQEPNVVGTWQGVDFEFNETTEGDHSAMIEGGMRLHNSSVIEIDSMGQYTVTETSTQYISDGEWIRDGKYLKFFAGFDTAIYEIVELNDSILTTVHSVGMNGPSGDTIGGTIKLVYKRLK